MRLPGRGSTKRSSLAAPAHYAGLRRIVVAFDEETFGEVRTRAVDGKTSFAEQVRLLVEWGLMQESMPADHASTEAAE
jgi:hypothetical protein